MDSESDPPDGSVPLNTRDSEISAFLSDSLGFLSMNPSEDLQHPISAVSIQDKSTSLSPTHGSKLPPMASKPGLGTSAPSSRRSSAAYRTPSSPSSPKLNRKTSGLSQTSDQPSRFSPRRSTSQTLSPKSSAAHGPIPEKDSVPATASSIAAEYFKRELDLHQNHGRTTSDTVVIVHDSCYGHRFSRPKISKINLSFIVERPERIKAGVLGLSSAYVRLGDKHAGADNAPQSRRQSSSELPFLISKSTRSVRLDSPAVSNVHGTKWMQELTTMCNAAEAKLASGGKELNRPDTPSSSSMKPRLHEGDLYLCKESLEALQGALGGVLDGVDAVFGYNPSLSQSSSHQKKAFVCVRPPGHHCSADMPSGFCWLNNVHVGIEHAALNHGLTHAAIIDFDLHHGDGSQAITWERNSKAAKVPKNAPQSKKTSIGYFSLHDINSYPCEDGDREKVQNASLCIENSHGQSIWNVHLQAWKTEEDFWDLYQSRYLILLDKARAFLRAQTQRIQSSSSTLKPKAAIFISAGFDASEWEGAGMQRHKVNVPTEFYARFTSDILKLAEEEGTSTEGRVVSVLEGGYSDRALMSGVLSHITGLVGPQTPTVQDDTTGTNKNANQTVQVDDDFHACKDWWSSSALSELETMIRPKFTVPAPRKIRSTELATYASPTQSFTAKVVDPSKVYRSLSGAGSGPDHAKSPTPPPPEVDWATAVHELSKLLIPTNRSVDSWRHDELTEPRSKRERHSSIDLPFIQPPGPLSVPTRARRGKTPAYNDPVPPSAMGLPARPASTSRRRTVSNLLDIPDENSSIHGSSFNNDAERPATSDSKTHSDGSVPQLDTTQDVSTESMATNATEGAKLSKTRRKSGATAEVKRMADHHQPHRLIPPISKPLKAASHNKASKPHIGEEAAIAGNSTQTSEIDKITSGVKKITLRMSKEGQDPKAPAPELKPAVKAPRKTPAPRAPKTSPSKPKPKPARATNASKTVGPVTNIPVAPDLAEQAASMAGPTGGSQNVTSLGDVTAGTLFEAQQPPADPKNAFAATVTRESTQPELSERSIASSDLSSLNRVDEVTSVTSSTPDTSFMMPVTPETPAASFNIPTTHTEFIPFNPPHIDSNALHSVKPGSLTWLPPNTNTPVASPVAKRAMENLPVFTKDGYIPFAPAQNDEEQIAISDGQNNPSEHEMTTSETAAVGPTNPKDCVWDVPVTPQR